MSDDLAPAVEQDKPDLSSAPEEGQAPSHDWEKQYQELRSEYNRRDSEIAELRQLRDSLTDPETAPEVFRALGYELPEEPDQQQEYVDPYEQQLGELRQQVEQLTAIQQQEYEQIQHQQVEEQMAVHIGASLDQIENQLGRQFDDKEIQFLSAFAYQNPDQNGLPNVGAAWEQLQAYEQAAQQRWIQSKRAPRVQDGQSASKQYDLSTPQGRSEYAEARLAGLDEDNVVT